MLLTIGVLLALSAELAIDDRDCPGNPDQLDWHVPAAQPDGTIAQRDQPCRPSLRRRYACRQRGCRVGELLSTRADGRRSVHCRRSWCPGGLGRGGRVDADHAGRLPARVVHSGGSGTTVSRYRVGDQFGSRAVAARFDHRHSHGCGSTVASREQTFPSQRRARRSHGSFRFACRRMGAASSRRSWE